MKVQVLLVGAVLAVSTSAAVTKAPVPVRDRFNGVCKTDADCEKFAGTVCVQIVSGDYTQGKCTPNYGTKPVCRGGQAGLCPSYQDPSMGYLNTQCVLIDKAMQPATDTDAIVPISPANKTTAPAPASGSSSSAVEPAPAPKTTAAAATTAAPTKAVTTAAPTKAARFLALAANTTLAPVKTTAAPVPVSDSASASAAASGSGSGSGTTIVRTPVKSQPCPTNPALTLADPKCWFTAKFKNSTMTVQYQCLDYDMCLSKSAYAQEPQPVLESYCRPKGCVTAPKALCNNRGTCQANSAVDVMLPRVYTCRCYAGYTGDKCEKSDGTAQCDVDCGLGGACIDNTCSCFTGYVGKNVRCDKCTSDIACENGNKCNLDAGTCTCKNGFMGPTCGGKTDICAGVTCSNGGFIDGTSGKACQCVCPKCPSGTKCTNCGGLNGTDCSTCPGVSTFDNGAYETALASLVAVVALLAVLA